jgi:hypothetical protein
MRYWAWLQASTSATNKLYSEVPLAGLIVVPAGSAAGEWRACPA